MPSVGKPIPHDSAVGHVTGQALYLDDVPRLEGELLIAAVGSPVAAGKLLSIDAQAARKIPGVAAVYTAADVGGENLFGLLCVDEPFLASEQLLYLGQPVAVVAAETEEALRQATAAVTVQHRATKPLLELDSAVEQERFLGGERRIARGDPEQALRDAPCRLSGVFRTGGQEQFYLESQAAIAYPGEDQQLVIHSSTQNPTEIQAVVAEVLGLGQHEVVCLCKRMGGAFGGKETQAALPALMAALVAHRLRRPARVIYDKDTDMRVTGKRHEYLARWEVGFDRRGVIEGLRIAFYSNGGAVTDLSPAVLERTLLHADNGYYLPHVELTGRICFTNLPPNTAFRGFGGPQAMATIENVLEQVAEHLLVDAVDVRRRNLYGVDDRNTTPYGQLVERNHLPAIVDRLVESSGYRRRRFQITRENLPGAPLLRGLALTVVKFGISFTAKFLNQASALVNVYTDGTIQVSTGGTEMGQGLNTKIRQLVADEFDLDPAAVRLMITSTEKNNNASPTAASASTDLNGAAAIDACRQIKRRLRRFAAEQLADSAMGLAPSTRHISFRDGTVFDRRCPDKILPFGILCDMARRERISLGARGFFATPGVDFNRETGRGTPFFYYTQGAAVAEVVVDRFTGELSVPRVDLLIDIGKSINPGVDRGQVIGGFVQGMGWATTEALVYGDDGSLLSYSPTTYKIPASTDVPPLFNVDFFDRHDNVQNIRRSKAVGEPPLMHAIAVWAAVKNALGYASPEAAAALNLPATGEEILRCLHEAEQPTAATPGQEGKEST